MTHKRLTQVGVLIALAAMSLLPTSALSGPNGADSSSNPWPNVVQAKTFDDLSQKWCAADRNVIHVFVLPASLFVDSRELICDTGTYRMYRVQAADDPDDFEYYIDPPFGKEKRLGCDGKAGVTVNVVAVNCRPE